MGSTVTSARVTGALLVERGLVTAAQLGEALEHQRANGGDLEDVLQHLYGVEPAQVATVVGEYRRREISVEIGSLLIAAGAVDEERLAEARQRSAETGQPLGPILVEMGAITRLELASALADQWSDSPAQILPPPGTPERLESGASAEDVEDLRFAMRALEASVRAERHGDQPLEDDALEEIQRREDVLAARVTALEIAIDQPIEVDPAVVEELHATAERLAAVQASLADLARAEDVAALGGALQELEALREAVAGVDRLQAELPEPASVRRAVDGLADLSERVAGVITSLEQVATTADLEGVAAALDELAARPVFDPGLTERVDELAARPAGDPELRQRLDELAHDVASLTVLAEASTGPDGLREAVGELDQRIEGAAAAAARAQADLVEVQGAVAGLGGLTERLDAVEGAGGALHARVEELSTALEPLASRIDQVVAVTDQAVQELETVRSALAPLTERVSGLEAVVPRVDELENVLERIGGELATLVARPGPDPELGARLDALGAEVAGLTAGLDRLGGLPEAVADAAFRIAAVEGVDADLRDLREVVGELQAGANGDPGLADRVARLADRVEALSVDALGPAAEAAVAGLAQRVEELASRREVDDRRSADREERLESLQAQIAELAARGADASGGPGARALEGAIAELRLRLDGTAPASAVASLLVAVEELQAAVGPLRTIDGRFESVERRLAAAESRVGEAVRASDGAVGAVREQLEAMSARTTAQLASVLERLDRIDAEPSPAALDDGLREDVAALGGAVETLRASLASEIERMERAWAAEREALAEQAAVAAAAPGQEAGDAAPPSGATAQPADLARIARDLERLGDRVAEQERSLVEHFARRERALVERLGAGTDVGQRLAELTRRIEEVRVRAEKASAGAGGGASDEELSALKEALFTRLERLASSVDWRFQRLEGGPGAAASRTDLHTRVDQLTSLVEALAGAQAAPDLPLVEPATNEVFLALVPAGAGHQLVELTGPVPRPGEMLADPLGGGTDLKVMAIGSSPLPDDGRPCVFVEALAGVAATTGDRR